MNTAHLSRRRLLARWRRRRNSNRSMLEQNAAIVNTQAYAAS